MKISKYNKILQLIKTLFKLKKFIQYKVYSLNIFLQYIIIIIMGEIFS